MAERRQLPPQIRRVELERRAGSKAVVRYQLTVDTGVVDGKRKQLRRRYRTEKEARAALAEVQGQVTAGTYVQPSTVTVEDACADWLRSRHKIRPTTAAGYEYVLQPVRSELGQLAVQDLTRRHIDELITELRHGSLARPGGRPRKAWSARSCNYMLGALSQVLGQLVAEGRLTRNIASLVDRVPGKAKKLQSLRPSRCGWCCAALQMIAIGTPGCTRAHVLVRARHTDLDAEWRGLRGRTQAAADNRAQITPYARIIHELHTALANESAPGLSVVRPKPK
jgi:hypothetical protein